MFVGHAALAFALAGGAAATAGVDGRRALSLGAVAGAFATAPDVDILYALVGLVGLSTFGLWAAVDAFWAAGTVVHRTVTHSLVVGVAAALVAGLAVHDGRSVRAVGVATATLLVGWIGLADGALGAATVAAFLVVGVGVAAVARGRFDLGPAAVLAAAAVGYLSHPFGDVLTGQPPVLLYPLDAVVVHGRVVLSGEPTLHLLGAFGAELATLWLAAVVFARLAGFRLAPLVDRRALVGIGYAAAVPVLPAPTLATSYHFVFSVVAFGAVGAVPARVLDRPDSLRAALVTGLTAVTLAGAAYAVAYLLALA